MTFHYRYFPTVLSQKSVPKDKRKHLETSSGTMTEADKTLKNQLKEKQDMRKCLVVGINEVTRGLEKDELALVLVCRSVKPRLMTDHILLLAATRQTPTLGLQDLGQVLAPLLHCKKAAAVGFKKQRPITVFDSLVEIITQKVPEITVPWLKPFVDQKHENTTEMTTEDMYTTPIKQLEEKEYNEGTEPQQRKRKQSDTSESPDTINVSAPKKRKMEEEMTERKDDDNNKQDNLATEDNNSYPENDSVNLENRKRKHNEKKEKMNKNARKKEKHIPSFDKISISCLPPVIKTVEPVQDKKKEGKKKKKKK
ncbi:hypothetical protein QZH41_013855 [Actinostola sp. cb2023]|nr:hypothetical protein QZH41_013855 [Actinostola sp. cb2023]